MSMHLLSNFIINAQKEATKNKFELHHFTNVILT